MNLWDRVDHELGKIKRDWQWLADALGLRIQAVNHWKNRGIPAKHYAGIEDALGKVRGWAVDGQEALPSELSDMAQGLAALFDMIPKGDVVRRSRAYAIAWNAISKELQGDSSTPPSP